ncbi:MAG: DUF29 domain-containing protein [Acidobacteria bacterium]|nr:DUF29 domain-containing protein [Acidobacteriota bacterium]
MDWQELATTSHYQTAVTVKEELVKGNIEEATAGIEELIEALSRSDKRALRSQLIRLMTHIIKWKTQPEGRSRSWAAMIASARVEIAEMLESEPSLKPLIPAWLTDLFDKATYIAEKEMNQKTALTELSWQEVFDEEYDL